MRKCGIVIYIITEKLKTGGNECSEAYAVSADRLRTTGELSFFEIKKQAGNFPACTEAASQTANQLLTFRS